MVHLNPFCDIVYISVQGTHNVAYAITLFNKQGAKVQQATITSPGTFSVDKSNLSSGTYLIKIVNQQNNKTILQELIV